MAALLAAAAAIALGIAYGTPVAGGDVTVSQSTPSKARVLVHDNYFDPRSAEVAEDGVVTWKWKGLNRHSIRFTKVPAGASRKGAKKRSEGHWKRSFVRPGVYRYVCRVWSGMRGTVTVRPAPPKPEQ